MHFQLAFANRAVEFGLESDQPGRLGSLRRREHLPVGRGRRRILRHLGRAHELGGGTTVPRRHRDADARLDHYVVASHGQRRT